MPADASDKLRAILSRASTVAAVERFLNTLTGIFGDYATVAAMETFTATAGERHPTDLAMLRGARLVSAQETEELREAGFDLGLTGFGDDQLQNLLYPGDEEQRGLTEDDAIPQVPATPVTRRSDLWLMGGHRLLCGDSTLPEDVIRLMSGERAALFATDPPFCNGPSVVNPFLSFDPVAGVSLLSGVSARLPPDGVG